MRHRVATKRLKRTAEHRKAMLMNLSQSLIEHEKVETTLTKAKYVRPYFEKLITKAKRANGEKDKVAVFNIVKLLKKDLHSDAAVRKLVEDLAPRFAKRNGGYVRIIKTGERDGDKSPMARIELVEKPVKKAAPKTKKTETKKKAEVKDEK